jgi:hypothetical protein
VLKSAIQKVMGGYYGHMAKLISDGQQDGSFRTDLDADETARFVAATIQGLIMRWSIFDFDFAQTAAEIKAIKEAMGPALSTSITEYFKEN